MYVKRAVPKAGASAKIGRCCYKTRMKRLTVIVALPLLPFAAAAQSAGVLATRRPITWGMIFALLFLMLGPIKLLAPFTAATKDCDRVFRLRLATRAFLVPAAAVTVPGALGQQLLGIFVIPYLVRRIAAGLILFLVALQAVIQQYDVTHPRDRTEPPTLAHAFSPLAFPTIVTPYGIAAVIILISLAPTTEIRFMVVGVVYFILFLDWLAMLVAHTIVRWFNPLLLLLGVILGVSQVALGLQLMLCGVEGLIAQGVFTAPGK